MARGTSDPNAGLGLCQLSANIRICCAMQDLLYDGPLKREYGPLYKESALEKAVTWCFACGLSLPRMTTRFG